MTALLLLPIALAGTPAASDSWPGFRGDGTGRATGQFLLSWSPTENIAWRALLPGYGQSSPVVWNGRVFVTAIDGPEKESNLVVALDARSGKQVWRKQFPTSQPGKNNPMMSRAAPTPVADPDGLIALFESGDLIALTHDGGERWRRSLSTDYGEIKANHGLAASLAQTERAAFVQVDHNGPAYLLAVAKDTGETLWKVERPSRTAWTSPAVVVQAGRPVVVASGGGTLTAYDAGTGEVVWQHEGLVGNNFASPTPAGDLLLIGAAEGRAGTDLKATAKSNCCVRLTGGSHPGHEIAWQAARAVSHHASPVAAGGVAYFVSKTGVVHGLDLTTGEELFAERLDEPCWATPIVAGDRVYFFGKDGTTTVARAGREFEKLASNRLWAAEDAAARKEAAKRQAAATLPKPPEGRGPGGGPPLPKEELEAIRYSAVGDVVYGAAAAQGALFLRTGTEVICVRQSDSTQGETR